jgi:beta-N-acetylhexosaminidase
MVDAPAAPPISAATSAADVRLASSVVIATLDATATGPESRAVLRLHPAGVIVFSRHLRDGGARVRAALDAAGEPRPLLFVDQEGGVVRRFERIGPAPAPRLGAGPVEETFRSHRAAGRALRAAGVAVDFAPVADVRRPGGVMGARSFGARPAVVARHGVAADRGLRAGGVTGCVKHYPGLGATPVNTDLGVGVDRRSAAAVRRDLAPFAAAVRAGTRCVMVSSVVVPSWCPLPAALCRGTYRRLRALGFRGAIVTDSLNARGLAPWGTPPALAVQALAAGADGAVMTGPGSSFWAAYAVRRAVERGTLDRRRLAAAAARLRALRPR